MLMFQNITNPTKYGFIRCLLWLYKVSIITRRVIIAKQRKRSMAYINYNKTVVQKLPELSTYQKACCRGTFPANWEICESISLYFLLYQIFNDFTSLNQKVSVYSQTDKCCAQQLIKLIQVLVSHDFNL